ncbi:sensor histidine kinase [Brachybacterium sp. p3-SID1565]|uniref:sensor histidine kinase n=1 Tax=Brachybacterium sp. p3-SID1565 TaxID=2916046 RepID=UPI0021A92C7C|nr:sensor histidine kinase [Brachybacterium sp. p3-SID1565]MCT1386302.1 sensor histidine kinase [Brachybacterium sp. p3-SID1565]
MSLVQTPLRRPERTGRVPAGLTARAMEVGRHLIAVALTVIGVLRALADGVAPAAAIVAGLAILGWHAAGSVIATRPAPGGSAPGRIGPRAARPVWWLLGLAMVWVAAVAVSPEFVWLAFLLWLLAGHLLPLWWGLAFAAAVLVVVGVAPVLHHGSTSWANVLGPLIGGVFAFGISRGYLELLREAAERERLLASLTRAHHELAQLQDELALAQRRSGAIEERHRLSRDIHDTVAQGLSSIRLLSHAESQRTADPEAARTLDRVERLAQDSLVDVRRIVAALLPAQLEDDALTGALHQLLDRFEDETGMQVALHVDGEVPPLPSEVEVALLRTAQSALGNVRRHSGATRVAVSLSGAGDSVRLDVRDDGTGFDVRRWEAVGPGPEQADGTASFGLRFMRQRLRELGGDLEVESTPGEGTAISAHLPHVPRTRTGAAPVAPWGQGSQSRPTMEKTP